VMIAAVASDSAGKVRVGTNFMIQQGSGDEC